MDTATILIKIAGVLLFAYTAYAFTRHLKNESKEAREAVHQSKSEKFLNGIILYLWYFFITAFSLGMIINN